MPERTATRTFFLLGRNSFSAIPCRSGKPSRAAGSLFKVYLQAGEGGQMDAGVNDLRNAGQGVEPRLFLGDGDGQ